MHVTYIQLRFRGKKGWRIRAIDQEKEVDLQEAVYTQGQGIGRSQGMPCQKAPIILINTNHKTSLGVVDDAIIAIAAE